jgi:FtsZ-binding cell division protein ZapB
MTDKEFKRLNRAQLIEIIYRLQLQVDELTEQKQALESALEDRRLRIHNAGNIAEAALELNNCFLSAQNAAEQYLNEIKAIYAEVEEERQRLLAEARAEAAEIIENAKKEQASQSDGYATMFERLWATMGKTEEET